MLLTPPDKGGRLLCLPPSCLLPAALLFVNRYGSPPVPAPQPPPPPSSSPVPLILQEQARMQHGGVGGGGTVGAAQHAEGQLRLQQQ